MTEEELEKEAEEYASNVFNPVQEKFFITRGLVQGHIAVAFKDGAEFGYNKAKEEMQEQGLALQSDMDKTIEQNIKLKAQIEKMKCCGNCAKRGHICVAEEMQGNLCGKNKVKWELRR